MSSRGPLRRSLGLRGENNAEFSQRRAHEVALADSRVRDDEISIFNAFITEQQDVHVDDAWTPASRRFASALVLHFFGCGEKLTRGALPLHLDDLVQETRLVGHTPRRGLNNAALTQYAGPFLPQAPAGSAEVARTAS